MCVCVCVCVCVCADEKRAGERVSIKMITGLRATAARDGEFRWREEMRGKAPVSRKAISRSA